MKDLALVAVRAVASGLLVAAFSMAGDVLKPKLFAGLFGAAPSVATASLLVVGLSSGAARDTSSAEGMIAGAVGLALYSLAAAFAVKHLGAVPGSLIAYIAWVIPAAVLLWLLLR